MSNYTEHSERFLCDVSIKSQMTSSWFSHDDWIQKGVADYFPDGRRQTLKFTHENEIYVLRHYYRGGYASRFLRDRFINLGFKHSRPFHEWHVTQKLFQLGLPVPQPMAIRYQSEGLLYRGDIITKCIPDAVPLSRYLLKQSLPDPIWQAIGATLKLFHQFNVFHADLNAHNILVDQQEKIWLIDFDKAWIGHLKERHHMAMLDRLHRSLVKLQTQIPTFHFQDDCFHQLLTTYSV